MIKKLAVLTIGIFVLVSSASAQKRKVAVLDFGYATVRSNVQAFFGTDQDIGKGISDQLVTALLEGGDYKIIERAAIDKIMKEQDFSNSDRADPATAVKIGGLLGVDAVILGDITSFGNDDKTIGGGGGGGTLSTRMATGFGLAKAKTIVEISARIVDVNSAEVLAGVRGHGQTSKYSPVMGGAAAGQGAAGAGAVGMKNSNFAQSEMGKAVKLAVGDLAKNLDGKAGSLPPPAAPRVAVLPPLSGLVADVSGDELVINVGTKSGVKTGGILSICHVDREITDPATKKLIRTVESTVGALNVTNADDGSATGKFNGSRAPTVGDRVQQPGCQ